MTVVWFHHPSDPDSFVPAVPYLFERAAIDTLARTEEESIKLVFNSPIDSSSISWAVTDDWAPRKFKLERAP